ncbi:3-deoxy-D-manno-octulosonic-acid transferase [Pseudomonas syringae pv. actinidiae ICMP 18807]|uniref:3-deoxy-D-manno-octulosonic acid transferase n=1 Tax=Pseudomonas syringae pv. actinidiae ICMP 18807 TaxID=1194404 RepID=S6UTU2_PSESF|nr:3-deoxy-D-manno-octulosonic-acid transferase [Pseudomonas syringae pv. actinidiae ICMP 18807]
MLEPAALAKPVLSGPHLFNFLEIAAMLRTAGALQEVSDATVLATAVQGLIDQPQQARSMADAGLAVMKANQGALQRLLDGIERLMAKR